MDFWYTVLHNGAKASEVISWIFTTTRQKKAIIPSSSSRIFGAPAQAEYNDVRTDLRLEPHLAVLTPLLAISGRVQVANQIGF